MRVSRDSDGAFVRRQEKKLQPSGDSSKSMRNLSRIRFITAKRYVSDAFAGTFDGSLYFPHVTTWSGMYILGSRDKGEMLPAV